MRKRFFIIALVLAVVGTLSAATYTTYSSHIILHGAKVQMQDVTFAVGAAQPQRPRGVPANAQVTTITLHGSFPTKKGVSPALGGGVWNCSVSEYAWADAVDQMAGDTSYACSGATLITFDEYGDYCAPVLWGCIWQNKYTWQGCTIPNPQWGQCPIDTYYYVFSIPRGQLWRERASVCAWGPPGTTSDCGWVSYQVQF